MFNLGNLITSCMLATGVATATPVNHAENIITNYELKLDTQNSNTQTYNNLQNLPTEAPQGLNTNYDEEYIVNFRKSNAYVNIIGTRYSTFMTQTYNDRTGGSVQERNKELILNYNALEPPQPYNEFVSTDLFVFQIDAYNYNINNEFNIQLVLEDFEDYGFKSLDNIKIDNIIFYKETFVTYQSNWSTYLQRQNVSLQANNIYNDIQDVNNDFYYTKNTSEIWQEDLEENDYKDETQIDLLPNGTTYVIIKYTPCAVAEIQDSDSAPWEQVHADKKLIAINRQIYDGTSVPLPTANNNVWMLGTNIIPDANIEVIDLPGLMWQILTMPFAFVSQAFNLTLFPGTPYQINISNLFLSIIAVAVFVWLISFFLKMKG